MELPELLDDTERDPGETDPFTMEQLLLKAGYTFLEERDGQRLYLHPATPLPVSLRFDRALVPAEFVLHIIRQIRWTLSRTTRQ